MTDVIVVGSGPTGLMLAGELALAGVDVEVLERRPTAELVGTRARGFHARTLEIFDQRGLAERFLDAGDAVAVHSFAGVQLDVADLPTRHGYTLALSQGPIEGILRGWVEELGVPIRYGAEVVGLDQDHDGVDLRLAAGGPVRSAYVVGADGGRSVVRKTVGIGFPGAEPTRSQLVGEARTAQEPPPGIRRDAVGIHGINPVGDGIHGFVLTEQEIRAGAEPGVADVREALAAAYGSDFGIEDVPWVSRFTDACRQASEYRVGRVLVAGDAAHVHPPVGGQGVGLGVQDAVNLGWKLGRVVRGASPESLLDTYVAERHPATARVLANVLTLVQLQRSDVRTDALRSSFAELLASEAVRAQVAGLLSGLDVRYADAGHPLLGRRMPDLDLVTADGACRVYELLHEARPFLLSLDGSAGLAELDLPEGVRIVAASCEGPWELPVVGTVPAPTGVLVRPDGHVAWVGEGSAAGLAEVVAGWSGQPRTA